MFDKPNGLNVSLRLNVMDEVVLNIPRSFTGTSYISTDTAGDIIDRESKQKKWPYRCKQATTTHIYIASVAATSSDFSN